MSAVLKGAKASFRSMNESDLPAVLAIEQRAYPFPWTMGIFRDCLRAGYSAWVYERNTRIDAYGVATILAGEAHILNLTVRPECHRRGLGEKMLSHFVSLCRRHKADTILLEVRPSNQAALKLYCKLGFNEVGVRHGYYPAESGREDALILARNLG